MPVLKEDFLIALTEKDIYPVVGRIVGIRWENAGAAIGVYAVSSA
jgi:hypothetical protein